DGAQLRAARRLPPRSTRPCRGDVRSGDAGALLVDPTAGMDRPLAALRRRRGGWNGPGTLPDRSGGRPRVHVAVPVAPDRAAVERLRTARSGSARRRRRGAGPLGPAPAVGALSEPLDAGGQAGGGVARRA